MICHDIFLLSDRQWGTMNTSIYSFVFLASSYYKILIIYRIYDYLICWGW